MPLAPPKPKHTHAVLKFPEKFLWGSATSAHQVEGNNIYNDWWDWEQKNQPEEKRSGPAANQYNLYESDFELAKKLDQNAHRLSIEWSRIEPSEGEFNQQEIDHYKKVLYTIKSLDMKVMLTLWHFTIPLWLANKGGWENGDSVMYFERFVKTVAPQLKDYVNFWVILNEPDIYIYQAYVAKQWPGNHGAFLGQVRSYLNLASAYKKVYEYLHELTPNKPAGLAQNIQSYEPYHKHSFREQLAVMLSDELANHLFYHLTKGHHDFLGVNYYFHRRYVMGTGFLPQIVDVGSVSKDVSDLGWEVYPEGIFDILMDMSDHIPIYVTECGIASTNDDRKTRFLIHYLQEIYQAIQSGVNIKGFFYWSLIDNFEWSMGYDPRFGLIEVDYKTQKRTPRTSAYVYREIIRHNGIPHHLLKLLGHEVNVKEELEYMKLHEGSQK